ncbi:MAG TPA: AMIN domain-containing protein, partial [Nitrospira sp.]|nr:AMIN domain-containing protein [Nitrospira sp.]
MTAPSIGAPVDVGGADPSTSSSSGDLTPSVKAAAEAQILTGIDVQQEGDGVNVTISGDGTLLHEATKLGERRLVIDIPNVASGIRKSVVNVSHPLLGQIRLGYHVDKVRVVFDLSKKAQYAVEPNGANLLVKLRQAAAGSVSEESGSAMPQVVPLESVVREDQGVRETVQSRGIHRVKNLARRSSSAFHIRPVQTMTEPDAAEKLTPKDDIVLGETRYVGRRISLDFQQADISNVLRLIA